MWYFAAGIVVGVIVMAGVVLYHCIDLSRRL